MDDIFSGMDTFIQRVAARILPLSQEKLDVKLAFTEWGYSGTCYDLGEPSEDCKLCDHPGIRYQFEIQNQFNSNKLLVGSKCIKRFEIGGEEGVEKVQADLNKLLENARHMRVLFALEALTPVYPQASVIRVRYSKDLGFSPVVLFELLPLFEIHKIPFNAQDFVVRLRRHLDQRQLLDSTDAQYQLLLPCLSSTQKVKYSLQALEKYREDKKKKQEEQQKWLEAVNARIAASASIVSVGPSNASHWRSAPAPKPPPKPKGLQSKYHGTCPACGQDTYEQLIKLTDKGWTHVSCLLEAHQH